MTTQWDGLYDTVEEYNVAIKDAQDSLTRSLLVGEASTNESGGSRRSNNEVNTDKAKLLIRTLKRERYALASGATTVRSGCQIGCGY